VDLLHLALFIVELQQLCMVVIQPEYGARE
jgi:hypothetical protein